MKASMKAFRNCESLSLSGSSLNHCLVLLYIPPQPVTEKKSSCVPFFFSFRHLKNCFPLCDCCSPLPVPLRWPAVVQQSDLWPRHSMESCWRSERIGAWPQPVAASQPLPIKQRCDLLWPLLPKISRIELNLSLAKKDVWFLIVPRPRTSLPCL